MFYRACSVLFDKPDHLIHTDLDCKVDVPRTQEPNSDLPRLRQFYCLNSRRFIHDLFVPDTPDFANFMYLDLVDAGIYPKSSCDLNQSSEAERVFRVKIMDGAAPHNQIDMEVAAGVGCPHNGPRLRVEDPAMTL